MTYRVVLSSPARRDLNKLPESVAAAVIEFIFNALAENPHRVGKPLRFELVGTWSARRGEYRVIYTIDDEVVLVTVVAIDHRRDVYR